MVGTCIKYIVMSANEVPCAIGKQRLVCIKIHFPSVLFQSNTHY